MGTLFYVAGQVNRKYKLNEVLERLEEEVRNLGLEYKLIELNLKELPVPVRVQKCRHRVPLLDFFRPRVFVSPEKADIERVKGIRFWLPVARGQKVPVDLLFDDFRRLVRVKGVDLDSGQPREPKVSIYYTEIALFRFGLDEEAVADNIVYYFIEVLLRHQFESRLTLVGVDENYWADVYWSYYKGRMKRETALDALLFAPLSPENAIVVSLENAHEYLARAKDIFFSRQI